MREGENPSEGRKDPLGKGTLGAVELKEKKERNKTGRGKRNISG